MEFIIGIALAVAVTVFATQVGFDRDGAFYPTVLMVIAAYYALFAVEAGSMEALTYEALLFAGFTGVAVVGFKKSLWIVAIGLFAHGLLDLVHGQIVSNPGVPAFWPGFCLGFDLTAAAYLAWRLARRDPLDQSIHGS